MSESDVVPDSSAASAPPVIEPSTTDAPPVVESHAPPVQPLVEGAIEAPIEAAVAETAGQKEFRRAMAWVRAKILATILAMRNSLGRTVSHLTIYLCLLTFLTLWARSHWTLELLTHFRAYYALALAAGCVLCLLLWRWRTALFASLFLIWHVTLIAPFYMDSPATKLPLGASHGDELRGITVNVSCRNKNKEAVLSYIREQEPDFVFLMEIDADWAKALDVLKEDYPHHHVSWRGGAFGLGFFSRVPTKSIKTENIGSAQIPTLTAELTDSDGRDFTVVGTHPLPPVGSLRSKMRNEQLAAVAAAISRMDNPVLLMGDLNMTSWSPYFQDLLKNANLRDTRVGFGLQGTWAPHPRIPLRLPIDHVLATDDVFIRDRRVGPDIGSDHRPVVFDFYVLTRPTSNVDRR